MIAAPIFVSLAAGGAGRRSLSLFRVLRVPSFVSFVVAFAFYSAISAVSAFTVVVSGYKRNPAIVAVMKFASVPANIARSPRRARS